MILPKNSIINISNRGYQRKKSRYVITRVFIVFKEHLTAINKIIAILRDALREMKQKEEGVVNSQITLQRWNLKIKAQTIWISSK